MQPIPATDADLADVTSAFTAKRGPLAKIQHVLHRYPSISPAVVLILSSIVFTIFGHGQFGKITTAGTILKQTMVVASLAIGQTLIILTAGVDLAVGAGMLFTHMVIAKVFAEKGVPAIPSLLIGAAFGVALGALHGFLVTRVRLPPFIVTLGTFYMFQSAGLVYSEAGLIPGDKLGGEKGLLLWTGKTILPGTLRTSMGVVLVVALYVMFTYILNNTAWGSHVYSTGDDKEAARLAGINVNRVLMSVYMVAGLLYAVGGWVNMGRSGSASMTTAIDANLQSISAVVIGGTSLFGGRGRLSGTFIGALVVGVFHLGLSVARVDAYWENFAVGLLIIVAVAIDQWIRKVAK